MPRHNNAIQKNHFKKKWENYVKTWFDQPARKVRRRKVRAAKAEKLYPRPPGKLRPVVHGQTQKYNAKLRAGRGFTLDELKKAGIPRKLAPTIGIAVDFRRRNRCEESLQVNAQRLQQYKSQLILFPRNPKKPQEGEASKEEYKNAKQITDPILPIKRQQPKVEFMQISDDLRKEKAYAKIQIERTNQRLVGKRAKRAAEEEAAEQAK